MINLTKKCPLGDRSLSDDERIDWLLAELTIDEKLSMMASRMPDIDRLGIIGMGVGGEAAHGIEGRNDQNGLGEPDVTTSFPQPIGMSASWDTDLIRSAGEIAGTEGRVIYHRHPRGGLSRWAPTIDLERDPRWGRNEEAYGEDPVLSGEMSAAYIQGMQGDDPYYLRVAATLKHFYANNEEDGRIWKNSSIDPRNFYELYLEPFRRAIVKGKAQGTMAAYNRINGVPGMLNPQIDDILKKQFGLTHAVSDGGALELVMKYHRFFGSHAESIAAGLKAGVDAMSDRSDLVEEAAHEAYELGLITEEDLDRSIRNVMKTKLRLGIFDNEPANPYDQVTEEDLCSEHAQEVCRQLSRESVVLLKNDKETLPFAKETAKEGIAVIGPFADAWFQDWYGGTPHHKTTFSQGLRSVLGTDAKLTVVDGFDLVEIRCGDKGLRVNDDESISLSETPDRFYLERWGEGRVAFRCERTGAYLNTRFTEAPDGSFEGGICCDRKEAFDWFVTEIFHIADGGNGTVTITGRFDWTLSVNGDQVLMGLGLPFTRFTLKVIEDGMQKALKAARENKTVILALGSHPMIDAKECVDRTVISLPDAQQELLERVLEENTNTVLALFSNYCYTFAGMEKKLPGIIWSATGSQDMGLAMAECIFGDYAPAGRLNQTWYESLEGLRPIGDYDIIRGKRTYRYYDRTPLFAFGHGLTYISFEYTDLQVSVGNGSDEEIRICVDIENTGDKISDEVVQIYASAPDYRVPRPIRQLVAFRREKEILPGEKRTLLFEVPKEELRVYDVIRGDYVIPAGNYRIEAGRASDAICLDKTVYVQGDDVILRDLSKVIRADHFDDCAGVELVEGKMGFSAVTASRYDDAGKWIEDPGQRKAKIVFYDCSMPKDAKELLVFARSEWDSELAVTCDETVIGSFAGNTLFYDRYPVVPNDIKSVVEESQRDLVRRPIYTALTFPLDKMSDAEKEGSVTLSLDIRGDLEILYLKAK